MFNMMPQMDTTLNNWEQPIKLVKIAQSIVDYQAVNNESIYFFQGTIQPLSPKELIVKPISERSWEWLQIHTKINIIKQYNLTTNDRIIYNNKRYKIMLQNDYSLNGYYEFHLVEEFQ